MRRHLAIATLVTLIAAACTAADGAFHDYDVDLSAVAGWQALITRLRVDPGAVADAVVEVDSIGFP